MFYKDLIQYEPIESLVQLKDAAVTQKAANLVSTYVISEEMSDRISNLIVPQLQFDSPTDNKGLLIVGNYGTGKSHLLSVISAICGDAALAEHLTDEQVKEKVAIIAGRFKVVIRTELGSTTMPLRDILVRELEENLKKDGIDYTFPPMDKSFSIKKDLEDMMQAFHEVYPDDGLILVVDELLDYLRSRKGQDLVIDLNFLREIGEACKDLRFRFIAGIQEAIFDSPSFSFVADSLRRVKDRFEQVRIARRDLKYVVANRLLKKSADQAQKIREYLEPYTRYYDDLTQRMDEFVNLFPIHPNYIDTFESITLIEKREVLKTISLNIKQIIDKEVPQDTPGILAYDSYWKMLSDNPSNRANPDVKEVMEVNSVLISKIEQAFTKPIYKPIAIRIVNGLSIHRLTTVDMSVTIGATPQELKNNLFLYDANAASMGGDEPDKDLTTLVETVLREIVTTVSGQFISSNPNNGQFYLDLKKVDDFDAIIAKKRDTLGDASLNTYYNEALKRVLERMDVTPHVTNYNIWQYEINWRERNAPRSGYLFFGSPNERSTAVPQRDYYIYFLRPYDNTPVKDQKLDDEVFIYLNGRDAEFDEALGLFAASHELSLTASGNAKNIYLQKSEQYLRKVVTWLQKSIWEAFDVVYQGKRQSLENWAKGKNIREISGIGQNETANFRDIVNAIASICLAQHFENQAPKYPKFSVLITGYNRKQNITEALRSISGGSKTKQATAILDALQLLDGDRLTTAQSPIAQYVIDKLTAKGKGQVLNREELIEKVNGIEYLDPNGFRLEPEWVVVVLAAMVYAGDIVLTVVGDKFDATKLQYLGATDLPTLVDFKHIEFPKDWNILSLKALFELVGLSPGLAQNITQGNDEPVRVLQDAITKLISRIVFTFNHLSGGLIFWGLDLKDPLQLENAQLDISKTKEFLESLSVFNTGAKLKNFNMPVADIEAHRHSLNLVKAINAAQDFIHNLNPLINWLSTAEKLLPTGHPWQDGFGKAKDSVLAQVKELKADEIKAATGKISYELQKLKKDYIEHYVKLHSRQRLNRQEDKNKAELSSDVRILSLRKLGEIDIMPKQQVNEVLEKLEALKTCFNLTENNLQADPICPHCRFNAAVESGASSASHTLTQIDQMLEMTLDNWTEILLQNLQGEHTQESISLLSDEDKASLAEFINSKKLPDKVDDSFVRILKEVLAGLIKVTISMDELRRVISKAGGSITPDDLKRVLDQYIDSLSQGKNPQRVRIVLE
ncbi:MAG: DUF6079 family protein [Candidatus Cloacimonetes bacterium]|nr:DUF6079 family protein [Candidatus Cloacimonadota bacterium]